MDTIRIYLEKLGYTAEEQGRTAKFLTVFKDGLPTGFILPDLSVRMFEGEDSQVIEQSVAFIRNNEGNELVGGSEYLLASYQGCKLTTFYDAQERCAKYAVYIVSDSGEIDTQQEDDPDVAKYSFIVRSGLMPQKAFEKARPPLVHRVRQKIIQYLIRKDAKKSD